MSLVEHSIVFFAAVLDLILFFYFFFSLGSPGEC